MSWRQGPHHAAQKSTTTGTLVRALDDVALEGGLGDVGDHASRIELRAVAELSIESGGVTLAGRGGGGGDPRRAPARPDRHAALRRHGLAGARARRPPRDRLRRAWPRESTPAPTRTPTTTTTSSPTCSPCSTTAGSSARCSPAPRWAPTPPRGSRSTRPERVAGLVIITPAFDPDAPRAQELERWDALSAGLRSGGVEGFIEAYGEPRRARAVPRHGRPRPAPAPVRPRASRGGRRRPARGAALAAVRGWDALARIDVPAIVVASRDEADPGHPYAIGEP